MGIVQFTLTEDYQPTEDQIRRLEALKYRDPEKDEYDEDNPPLTDEQLEHMRQIAGFQRAMRKKEVVALRLDKESLNIARSFGQGYTGILGRILYKALRDPEYIKDCL